VSDGPVGAGDGGVTGPVAGEALPPRSRVPRVRTVVLGLVMLSIGVASLISHVTGARVAGDVLALALMVGSGVALVAGGIAAAVKEAHGGPGARR
jgi:hypothetical protein